MFVSEVLSLRVLRPRLTDFACHSTLGLRVMTRKKKVVGTDRLVLVSEVLSLRVLRPWKEGFRV